MYLITIKEDNSNRITMMGESLDYMSNGYPRLVNENVAFPDWMVYVHEIESVPSEVIPEKYCYTESDGFYINPNWVEPDATNTYGIPDETYHQILDDYTMQLIEEGAIA